MRTKCDLGVALASLRKAGGMTQAELGKKKEPSVARNRVHRVEAGEANIRWLTLLEWVEACGADLYDLVDAYYETSEKRPRSEREWVAGQKASFKKADGKLQADLSRALMRREDELAELRNKLAENQELDADRERAREARIMDKHGLVAAG